jgi:hypothetical protein
MAAATAEFAPENTLILAAKGKGAAMDAVEDILFGSVSLRPPPDCKPLTDLLRLLV